MGVGLYLSYMPAKAREAENGVGTSIKRPGDGAEATGRVGKAAQYLNVSERVAETIMDRYVRPRLGTDEITGQPEGTRERVASQVDTVLAVVTIGVVAIIGILVYAEIEASLPSISNTSLSNSSDDITSGFGDAMSLIPVVLLVLVSSVVIGIVSQLR
jgi:hypothetical protein